MPTAVTRATRGLRHGVSVAGLAVVALLVTACSDDGDDPVAETTESSTPSPVITAPPTKSPEEKAEAEIIDTFETLIARLDEYRSSASEYGNDGDPTWNVVLVGDLRVEAGAEVDLTNQLGAWKKSEIEQVGNTTIVSHDLTEITLNVTDSGIHEAESVACMDMTGLEYETYDGKPAELPAEPAQYQTWDMTWTYRPSSAPDSGIEVAGWHLSDFEFSVNEPC